MADHLNNIERTLIDNLRTGTYKTATSTATAWSSSDVKVFGQFPETEEAEYPCIIVQQRVNGIEEQFLGMLMSDIDNTTIKRGELYGLGLDIHIAVDKKSVITVDGTGYKQRRLMNYLMLNVANVIMDCDFSGTDTELVSRNHTGFRDMGYDPEIELWGATTGMIVVFKNTR